MTLGMSIASVEDARTFLTGETVPANLSRLKRGDRLAWADSKRAVVRVGYRKSALDFKDAAKDLVNSNPKLWGAYRTLRDATGAPDRYLFYALARGLASRARLGGPERGIVVEPQDWLPDEIEVETTRVTRLGNYYPPSGGGEDYEDGGLTDVRCVVLVKAKGVHPLLISGDLRRKGL